MSEARRSGRATMAGILIGVGMGGFVDGIVLHQILQWHNMLSHVVPPHTMDTMQSSPKLPLLQCGMKSTWQAMALGSSPPRRTT
jgi:uncharacterized membrane protein